jgi:hypothetical protein
MIDSNRAAECEVLASAPGSRGGRTRPVRDAALVPARGIFTPTRRFPVIEPV